MLRFTLSPVAQRDKGFCAQVPALLSQGYTHCRAGEGWPSLTLDTTEQHSVSHSLLARGDFTLWQKTLQQKFTSKSQLEVLKIRKNLKWYKLLHLNPLGEVGNDFVIKDLLWGSGELVQFWLWNKLQGSQGKASCTLLLTWTLAR